MSSTLLLGDSRELLAAMEPGSVSDIVIDNSGAGGSVYSLRRPEGVRDRLAGALRLSLGDLIESGGVSPAVGVGLLIEAGAL